MAKLKRQSHIWLGFLPSSQNSGLGFSGEVFIFKSHSIDPIGYYLFLCTLLLFLGKERAVLGTFHDSVFFFGPKPESVCSSSRETYMALQTQDFSRGFATTCLKVQRYNIIIYGRNLKCIIITLVKAGGSLATIRNI